MGMKRTVEAASFCRVTPISVRSLWSLTSCSGPRSDYLVQAEDNWKKSHTSAVHTSGDHELANFLKDEIKLEKDIKKKSGKLPKIKNFEVTKMDGPNIELTQEREHETVTVKFNVNDSVDSSSSSEVMEGDEQEEVQGSQIVSRPALVVEINKGGDKTLAIHCVMPHFDVESPEHKQDEQYEELLEIQDITLLNKSQEWTEDVYNLNGTVMDGNLYDMLLNMLEERGITAEFVDQVIDFSTSYEHRKYIEILEQLKEFAESK